MHRAWPVGSPIRLALSFCVLSAWVRGEEANGVLGSSTCQLTPSWQHNQGRGPHCLTVYPMGWSQKSPAAQCSFPRLARADGSKGPCIPPRLAGSSIDLHRLLGCVDEPKLLRSWKGEFERFGRAVDLNYAAHHVGAPTEPTLSRTSLRRIPPPRPRKHPDRCRWPALPARHYPALAGSHLMVAAARGKGRWRRRRTLHISDCWR